MPFQIDRTKTAQQNMLGLINSGSTYAFTGTEFTYGTPADQTPADPEEDTNSEVTVTAVEDSGFTGTKTVRYRRLALGQTRPGARQNYVVTTGDTLASLKEQIATEHNLVLDQFDLTGTLPTADADPAATFTLTAVEDSLLYLEGTHTVSVTFDSTP